MSSDQKKAEEKQAAIKAITAINAVEGFDPAPLAVEYTDLNTKESRSRLPVMAQLAWFRLKYPEGRIAISVAPAKDCFVATAKVYHHFTDPMDQFLAEATASRGYLADKAYCLAPGVGTDSGCRHRPAQRRLRASVRRGR